MKNKIAFITPLYLPANLTGSSVFVNEIAELFAKRGYDISIITSNGLNGRYWYDPIFGKKIKKKYEVINGVKVYRLSCNQIISSFLFVLVRKLGFLLPENLTNKLKIAYSGPYLIGLDKLLKREAFDIVNCSPFPLNINRQVVEAINKLDRKPKLIFTPFLHTELEEFRNPKLKKLLLKAERIHVVTNSEKDFLENYFGLGKDKIWVIPLFLSKKKNLRNESKEAIKIREKYGLNGKKIVLFAGNKGFMKGATQLLEAMSELFENDKSYRLIAIGNNMPEWINEKKKINQDFLLDFNYVDENTKELMFEICDVYCMPSVSESFGLTYLEAWAKRKPVIAADIPTSIELIANQKAGLLVKFGNVKDLKNKIEEIFENKKKAKEMGENGFYALNERYILAKLFSRYEKLFDI